LEKPLGEYQTQFSFVFVASAHRVRFFSRRMARSGIRTQIECREVRLGGYLSAKAIPSNES
jgi:hypothetical protein